MLGRAAILTIYLAAAATMAGAASTSAEISAALVGNTFSGGMGGSDYSSYFGSDGTYRDAQGSGPYVIENDAVCYPGTDFGCYQATIRGTELEWSLDGTTQGTGTILPGNPLNY